MKRSSALTQLSRDHHTALAMALRLRRAQSPAADRQAFLEFFESEGQVHFAIEEDVLLPAISDVLPEPIPTSIAYSKSTSRSAIARSRSPMNVTLPRRPCKSSAPYWQATCGTKNEPCSRASNRCSTTTACKTLRSTCSELRLRNSEDGA